MTGTIKKEAAVSQRAEFGSKKLVSGSPGDGIWLFETKNWSSKKGEVLSKAGIPLLESQDWLFEMENRV